MSSQRTGSRTITIWNQGRETIVELIARGHVERVSASTDTAIGSLEIAERHLASARSVASSDRDGAYQLAYDAGRKSLAAVLLNQGLRVTSAGGHIATVTSVDAQLNPPIRAVARLGRMRRRRNELEYRGPESLPLSESDVDESIAVAAEIIDIARRVIPRMPVF